MSLAWLLPAWPAQALEGGANLQTQLWPSRSLGPMGRQAIPAGGAREVRRSHAAGQSVASGSMDAGRWRVVGRAAHCPQEERTSPGSGLCSGREAVGKSARWKKGALQVGVMGLQTEGQGGALQRGGAGETRGACRCPGSQESRLCSQEGRGQTRGSAKMMGRSECWRIWKLGIIKRRTRAEPTRGLGA